MTETKKPEPKKNEIKPRVVRTKILEVMPSDIVEVWQLYAQSMAKAPQNYPKLEEEHPDHIRSNIFQMISQPNFLGVIAKVGRKPVGQLNGFAANRPYGSPRHYFQFWMFWVDPDYRKAGVGEAMLKELFRLLKAKNIHHFESIIDPAMVPVMEKVYGGQLAVVSHRIVGKVKAD